jgi:hypothetical protein
MKKQILLTALTLALLASAVMTAAAEEVMATIITSYNRFNIEWVYDLDTMPGDGIIDRRFSISTRSSGLEVFDILPRYLKEGWIILYESNELKPFEDFGTNRMIEIISPDNIHIDITTLFSITRIRYSFSYLYAKLVREGRAR